MGSLEIKIIDETVVNTIPVKRAVQILEAVFSLYYNLGISNKELKNYSKDLFKLELSSVHFSKAKIQFKTTAEHKPLLSRDSEFHSKPINTAKKIIYLKGDMESKKALDTLISKKRVQRKALDSVLKLIPHKESESIEIEYKSSNLAQSIKFPKITFELRKPLNSLKRMIASKSVKEKIIIGNIIMFY